MTTRRQVIRIVAVWPVLAAARAAVAQAKAPVTIGWLENGSREADAQLLTAFKSGMASHGWVEGTQYLIEERWLYGRMDQLPVMAKELAAKKPRVIVAQPSSLVAAAAKAAPDIPIVQMGGSPLEAGNVARLARPDGMITGLSGLAANLSEKLVELLRETMPAARRVGFLMDPRATSISTTLEHIRRAIKRYEIDARFSEVTVPDELESGITRLAKDKVQAIIVLPNIWFSGARHRITQYALAHQLPLVAGGTQYPEVGALLGYGADASALRYRAAYFVDRILKGAKPSDLPVEQPTRFELSLNLRTAKKLGITIPQSILVQATRVIE